MCVLILERFRCTARLLLARLAPIISALAGSYRACWLCTSCSSASVHRICLRCTCHHVPTPDAVCRRRARRASTASPAIRRLRSLSGRGPGRPATRRRPGGPPAGHAPGHAPGTGPTTMATGISRARTRARTTTALFSWATSRTIPTRTRCGTSLRRMGAWRPQRCGCARTACRIGIQRGFWATVCTRVCWSSEADVAGGSAVYLTDLFDRHDLRILRAEAC